MADEPGREGDLPLPGGNRIPLSELVELASRSSGPGGQHVNTSSTRVTLRWNLHTTRGLRSAARARVIARLGSRLSKAGELVVHSDRHRSRRRNQETARERLREIVEAALHVEPPRRPTAPSRAAKRRRTDEKKKRGQLKAQRSRRDDDGH
ncbi:MAG: alternative ribosome rescue aminoacyl-tRNA hydrolase ArfB [Myxococcota bacterium]